MLCVSCSFHNFFSSRVHSAPPSSNQKYRNNATYNNQKTIYKSACPTTRTSTVQYAVYFALVQELRVLRLDRFQLDGHLLACGHVRAQVDVPERSAPNFPPQPVLLPHPQLHDVQMYWIDLTESI
jgi:hypothetical protein